MPPGNAARDERPVDAAGELLDSRKQGVAVDQDRQRLDETGARILLHRRRQPHDRVAVHQTVGVKHQHGVVSAAKAHHPFRDVARLARDVLAAVAVVNASVSDRLAQTQVRRLLGEPDRRIGRVAQDKAIEVLEAAGLPHRLEDRLHTRHHATRLFIIGRQQQRGARGQERQRRSRVDGKWAAAAKQRGGKAGHHADEGQRDPGEQHNKEHENDVFRDRQAADLKHLVHLVSRGGGHGDRRGENKDAAQSRRARRRRRHRRPHAPLLKRLLRHRQRALGGQGESACRADRGNTVHCGVHRYSHTSDTGCSPCVTCARNSISGSFLVSSSKLRRMPPVSGLG